MLTCSYYTRSFHAPCAEIVIFNITFFISKENFDLYFNIINLYFNFNSYKNHKRIFVILIFFDLVYLFKFDFYLNFNKDKIRFSKNSFNYIIVFNDYLLYIYIYLPI